MNHRQVCVKCKRFLFCKENGVVVVEMAHFGPYKLWGTDMWECPKCGRQILTGFGQSHMAEHYEDRFAPLLEVFKASGRTVLEVYYKDERDADNGGSLPG